MTKKTFEWFAKWIAECGDRRMHDDYIIESLMDYFETRNDNFDRDRFKEAVAHNRGRNELQTETI